jgi:hypothetical protein
MGEVFIKSSCDAPSTEGATYAGAGGATSSTSGVGSGASGGMSLTVPMLGDQRKFDLKGFEIFAVD